MEKLNELKEEILEKVKEYHNMKFGKIYNNLIIHCIKIK